MNVNAHRDADSSAVADLIAFLDASPSPWHAVESMIERLTGFERLDERDAWTDVPTAGFVVRDAALIAWRLPAGATDASLPFRLVGGHTDSPCLRVKPHPDAGGFGWKQLAVEVYGGILNNSWLDRDLGVAGRLIAGDGTAALVDVHEPIARVPQLAVHLDREVNSVGLLLDTQQHLSPVWGVGFPAVGDFAAWIGDRAGIAGMPAWWELSLYDVQGAVGARSRRLAAVVRSARQPAVVLGSGDSAAGCRTVRPRRADRDERSRGGRLVESVGSGRAVPRARDRPTGRVTWRNRQRPDSGTRRIRLRIVRQRACGAPELSRTPRAGTPTDRERWAGDQGELESALRHVGVDRVDVPPGM